MALTVFQYIPVLEEESGPDTELCKKSDDNSGDDDTCDDDSTESKDDQINQTLTFSYYKELASCKAFYVKKELYSFTDASITTPPPRF